MKWTEKVKGSNVFQEGFIPREQSDEGISIQFVVPKAFKSLVIFPHSNEPVFVIRVWGVKRTEESYQRQTTPPTPVRAPNPPTPLLHSKFDDARRSKSPYRTYRRTTVFIPVDLVELILGRGIDFALYDHAAMICHIYWQWYKDNFGQGIPIPHDQWTVALGISARWAKTAQRRLERAGLLLVQRTTHVGKRANRYTVPPIVRELLEKYQPRELAVPAFTSAVPTDGMYKGIVGDMSDMVDPYEEIEG